jgi:hypothetical protein
LIKFNVTATLLAIYLMLLRMKAPDGSTAASKIQGEDIIYIKPSEE